MLTGELLHPLAEAVTTYVTNSVLAPLFSSVWEMVSPVPAENPVTLGELALAVQVIVAPVTPADIDMAVVPPEQTDWLSGRKVTDGIG